MDKTTPHPLFKLATELGPLIVFFVANAKFHLFVATAAFAMGRRGIQFIEKLQGFEGYLIDAQARATYTSGFERFVLSHANTD